MKILEFCDLILATNKKIRYVGVYHDEKIYHKLQKNVKSHFTDEENMISVKTEVVRASMRRYMVEKLGEPIFSITMYPKVIMVTFHFMATNLVLLSMEPNVNTDDIINKIQNLIKTHGYSLVP
ncbi:hypothetical protein DYY67_0539 [Candidatus Nitrosotalea sp. TS]|uniref:hypothetical protein n=1 Tax=Candidatus Nitrosotalea sp. TS TaxID=2341020 RepID=UPI00140E43C1|nr:hypothetical protein [Candidatus Nitrosotalea sp. TS]NHI02500.1 hypothetical protein [Candidatus Nitrosotalea sp. TS]